MRDRLIDGLIQGDRSTWAAIGALWLLATIVVLLHRPEVRKPGTGVAWSWLLLATATATSLAGLPLSAALSIPRVRWITVETPDVVAPSGTAGAAGAETWRALRGPTVMVPGPDVAVPTIDADGRWVLFGLLSGHPVEGLPAAEPAPIPPGAPRLCPTTGEACRPWPVAWPDPARKQAQGDFVWALPSRIAADATQRVERSFAYDVETGLYLFRIEPPVDPDRRAGPAGAGRAVTGDGAIFELSGRLVADDVREGPSVLAVARRAASGRLRAARVVALPSPSGVGHVFKVQRSDVSLTAGPRVYAWVVRPLLGVTSFSLPLGVLVLLLAPLLRRGIAREEGRRAAMASVAPLLEVAGVLAAGLAAAAPAVVAIASLWGSR